MNESGWQVLLIGGSSGTGKTTIARQIARSEQISHLLVDDIRMALQATTTPEQQPDLHYFFAFDDLSRLPVERFIEGFIRVGRALVPALEAIVSHHLVVPETGKLVFEGDGILPSTFLEMKLTDIQGQENPELRNQIRCIFLVEDDEDALLDNFISRDRGFHQAENAEQRRYVHSIWHFGQWLKSEAHRHNLKTIDVRPQATLQQRIMDAVGLFQTA